MVTWELCVSVTEDITGACSGGDGEIGTQTWTYTVHSVLLTVLFTAM